MKYRVVTCYEYDRIWYMPQKKSWYGWSPLMTHEDGCKIRQQWITLELAIEAIKKNPLVGEVVYEE